jgi:hypothetical protein
MGATLETGTSSNNSGTGISTTLAVTVPSGVQVGDQMVIACISNVANVTFSATSFTALTAETATGEGTIGLLTHSYTGTEGWTPGTTTVTVTVSSTSEWAVIAFAVNGIFDPTPTTSGQVNSSSTTIDVTGITTTENSDLLVWIGYGRTASSAAPAVTAPTGFTNVISQVSTSHSGANVGVVIASGTAGTAGATGSKNGSCSPAETNGGVLLGFAPTASGFSGDAGLSGSGTLTATGSYNTNTRPMFDGEYSGWQVMNGSPPGTGPYPNPGVFAYGPAWTTAELDTLPTNTILIPLYAETSQSASATKVIDVENADITSVSTVASWIAARLALPGGYATNRPTVYLNKNGSYYVGAADDVITPLASTYGYHLGVEYDLWIADTTGTLPSTPDLTNGVPAVATQYASYAETGSNYDLDVIWDSTWNPPPDSGGGGLEPGSSASTSGTGTGTTIALTVPSGTQPGDIILIYCYASVIDVTFSAPSFAAQSSVTGGAGSGSAQLLTYTYLGTEGWTPGSTTITTTASTATEWACAIVSVNGSVDPAFAGSGQINTASTTIDVAGVTTDFADDLLVWFGFTREAGATSVGTITPPSGFSDIFSQVSSSIGSGNNVGLIAASNTGGAAGATGVQNGGDSVSQVNGGLLIAFNTATVISPTATLTGSGTLSPVVSIGPSSVLSGSGSLTAAGGVAGVLTGVATLTGSGSLSSHGAVVVPGVSTLSGSGSLTATAEETGGGWQATAKTFYIYEGSWV